MKPYKLKHKPTGLYYQPYKHGVGTLSRRGKIYQTKRHGLSEAFNRELKQPGQTFSVECVPSSSKRSIYQELYNWEWKPQRFKRWAMQCDTLVSDWEIEEI